MIGWLKGRLRERDGQRAIVDVQGVGYEVYSTASALDAWTAAGFEVEAYVYTQVREDAIVLYGFTSAVERRGFSELVSVTGIGPKLALACMDAMSLSELARAIDTDDVTGLAKIPGIGKKMAQRLALELKGKLQGGPVTRVAPVAPEPPPTDHLALALSRLGYSRAEIDKVQEGLRRENVGADAPIADRLRIALRLLYRGD